MGALVSFLSSATAEVPAQLSSQDFIKFDRQQAAIGQLLFYDKILSGNRNIACSTCHHPDFGTADGLPLGVGEGGKGLGPERTTGMGDNRIKKRIPRNAPALWNLGAKSIHTMFHDGRLSISERYENGFDSPAEEWLPKGFNSLLAAQAVFPLVAQFEMAGNPKENEIAGAVHDRIDAAWPLLAKRVRIIPEYGKAFVQAFDHIERADQITIVDIANALAAFMGTEWQSFDSPYDDFLGGNQLALTPEQKSGMDLFFGKANCVDCHSGALLSDQKFHALQLPAFGPGRTRRFDPIPRDVGRMGKSDLLEDAYRFRTPMLRNVALTAPYGHNGAYPTLEGIVRAHVEETPMWSRALVKLPTAPWIQSVDFAIQDDYREMKRQSNVRDTDVINLSDNEIGELVAFLNGLTGKTVDATPFGIPKAVPSGLDLD
ncbi:cytochrome-c peroxidase [Lentilitoribacter sp. EG35]|uniref:cytochrome-c peroxidase n=1 Tax=Lentilitoribacter sp. EG35 TaxID=3234192 RepID=UPI0034604FEC